MNNRMEEIKSRIAALGFGSDDFASFNIHLNDYENIVAFISGNCLLIKMEHFNPKTHAYYGVILTADPASMEDDGMPECKKTIIENDFQINIEGFRADAFMNEVDEVLSEVEEFSCGKRNNFEPA